MRVSVDWSRLLGILLILPVLFVTTWWAAQATAQPSYLQGMPLLEAARRDWWILPAWIATIAAWDFGRCLWTVFRAARPPEPPSGGAPTPRQSDPATWSPPHRAR